jgi:sortase A
MKLVGNALMICGTILVTVFIGARLHTLVGTNVALAQFSSSASSAPQGGAGGGAEPDTSLWSEGRIKAFRDTLGLAFAPPLAVLRIPGAGLEVPVLPGTDDASLNRGLGWIEGTTLPGMRGNVGVAGHRDGFFRVLKDVEVGDVVELATAESTVEYIVTTTEVIEPEDLHVLGPTDGPMLTLVTCYPFYFAGSAPQRFIVRAVPRGGQEDAANASPKSEIPAQVPDRGSGNGASQWQTTTNHQQGGRHQ